LQYYNYAFLSLTNNILRSGSYYKIFFIILIIYMLRGSKLAILFNIFDILKF
jgi:hypothetical protein